MESTNLWNPTCDETTPAGVLLVLRCTQTLFYHLETPNAGSGSRGTQQVLHVLLPVPFNGRG